MSKALQLHRGSAHFNRYGLAIIDIQPRMSLPACLLLSMMSMCYMASCLLWNVRSVLNCCDPFSFCVSAVSSLTAFNVKHYAGDVLYDVHGFVVKNRDRLHDDLRDLLRSSGNAFVVELFAEVSCPRC
jgi:hypothetical protein